MEQKKDILASKDGEAAEVGSEHERGWGEPVRLRSARLSSTQIVGLSAQ